MSGLRKLVPLASMDIIHRYGFTAPDLIACARANADGMIAGSNLGDLLRDLADRLESALTLGSGE